MDHEPIRVARLKDKTAVVTGAASGIGLACARRFVEEGARVFGLDVATEPPWRCDVSRWEEVRVAAEKIAETGDTPSILVHSAGVCPFGKTLEASQADFERTFQVNLLGAVNLVKAFDKVLIESASIIFISSINGIVGGPGLSAYAASKGALLTLARTLALELADRRIRVNSVCPASIDTHLLHASFARHPDPAQARARNILRHPLGRLGTPEDVANLVLFLASEESSWITGSTHMVDGGALINRS